MSLKESASARENVYHCVSHLMVYALLFIHSVLRNVLPVHEYHSWVGIPVIKCSPFCGSGSEFAEFLRRFAEANVLCDFLQHPVCFVESLQSVLRCFYVLHSHCFRFVFLSCGEIKPELCVVFLQPIFKVQNAEYYVVSEGWI